ncbi:uncharacterized protein TNCV_1022331 [Trichonephila clavipes]|nr:uncharacterized protein TNCV_1022331 [Trichonephila clavipes]
MSSGRSLPQFNLGVQGGIQRNSHKAKHEKWTKYYDRRRRDVQIKVNDWVLVKMHPLGSAAQKVVAKFKPKFEGPYRVLEVNRNNLVIWGTGKRLTVNADQVRLYHHRKSDEKEIRTSSSDSNSSMYKSSNFEGVQSLSNESQYSRKNGPDVSRELEEQGTGLKKDLGERHTSIANNRRRFVRSSPGSWTAPNKRKKEKRCRRDEKVMPSTSGYNLRPRRGAKVESPDHPVRRGHNKEDQFDPEETENNSTAPKPRTKEGQVVGV